MKVLVAHNRYQSNAPSGENQMVDAECDLLERHGVEVVRCFEDSDELLTPAWTPKVRAALGPLYSQRGTRRVGQLISTERPDVLHVHNVFPLLSPWIVRTAKAAGVPVVQTIHNYRHSCINGLHVREGRRCDDCLGRTVPWPGVAHGCYRGSSLQSLPMAASQVAHRNTWDMVDRYLTLTPFMTDRMVAAGLARDRITVRPTWVPDAGASPVTGRDLAYVGRLDMAKGVGLLLDAWRLRRPDGRKLVVVGDGPMSADVAAAAASDNSVVCAGRLDRHGVESVMRHAAAVVLPSIFYEGLPLTVAEAFSHGRPVIVLSGGSTASVVSAGTGWISEPNAPSLAAVMSGLDERDLVRRGLSARQYYQHALAPGVALSSLIEVYDDVRRRRALR